MGDFYHHCFSTFLSNMPLGGFTLSNMVWN